MLFILREMAERQVQVSESSSDSSQSVNALPLDVSDRVGVLENAVLEMRKDVRSLISIQSLLHSDQGISLNIPLSLEQNLPPRVPSFVTVFSAGSSIPIFSAQSSANQLPVHNFVGFTSQLFMTQMLRCEGDRTTHGSNRTER